MKIMGLTESAYFTSWLFHYFIVFTVTSGLESLVITQICDNSSILLIWFFYWLFCMTLFGKAVFVSSIVTKAKNGVIIGIGWFFCE